MYYLGHSVELDGNRRLLTSLLGSLRERVDTGVLNVDDGLLGAKLCPAPIPAMLIAIRKMSLRGVTLIMLGQYCARIGGGGIAMYGAQ